MLLRFLAYFVVFAQPVNQEPTTDLKIIVRARNVQAPAPVQVRMDPEVCGKTRTPQSLRIGKDQGLADVVAWVEGERVLAWSTQESSRVPTLTLKNCECEPRVMIAQPKEGIRILNEDPILHSLRAQGRKNYPIFRVHPPNLLETFMRFNEPEIVPVYSDLHPWMKAFIVVAPHQNYAISDADGRATVPSIPQGRVKLKLWHAIMGIYEYPTEIQILPRMETLTIDWPTP